MTRAIVVAAALGLGALVLTFPWPTPSAPADVEMLVRARQYAFAPGVLRVGQGDRVTLVLEAEDVAHGLFVDGYAVDIAAVPGRRARATFVADRAGKFRLRCSKVCGSLHPFMLGELIVEPNRPLWRAAALAIVAAAGTVAFLAAGPPRAPATDTA